MGPLQAAQARRRPQLPYVPGLDGLRAIAVILVLLYHADLGCLPGGFLGVEVFFVLSGYLITSLLLAEWDEWGRIDIPGFWLRRARRLLPAAYLMIAVTLAGAVLFLPQEVANLRRDAAAAVAMVTNWYLVLSQQSYFQIVGRPSLLQHLWSLSVEEQFYLLWPILFALGMRFLQRSRMLIITFLGVAASTLVMAALYRPDVDPSRLYYGTDTRAAGLLIGASFALAWMPAPHLALAGRGKVGWPDVAALSALAMLIALCATVNEFQPFLYRGGLALVAGTTAIAIAAVTHPGAHLAPRLLEWGPLRWAGQRSYSLYLWHWPVFMVTRPQIDVAITGLPLLALRVGATVVLAELSYRYVEAPVRTGALQRAWQSWRQARGSRRPQISMRWAAAISVAMAPSIVVAVSVAAAQPAPDPSYLSVQALHVVSLSGMAATPEMPQPAIQGASPQAPPTATLLLAPTMATLPQAEGPAVTSEPPEQPAIWPGGPAIPTPSAHHIEVTMIGDSVMLGAAKEIQKNVSDLDFDAAVNRNVATAIDLLRARRDAGELGAAVVVHIGNNGPFSAQQFDDMMQILAGVHRAVFVNIKVPRRWEGPNNAVLAAGVRRYANARLIDWNTASADRPELFWDDGIHLRPEGAKVYAGLIVAQLQAP